MPALTWPDPTTGGALSGVRVLDLTTYLPGPYATLLLADLGATVLAVEPPAGDPARQQPVRAGDDSALHQWVGRNKRSVVLDLKSESDRSAFLDLVDDADVVIEGYRPGVAHRLGVDADTCLQRNGSLVHCSLSGFGQAGAHAGAPAHDIGFAARSGLLDQTRGGDGEPGVIGAPVADIAGGTHAAVAILAALLHARATGEGQSVDVAVMAATVATMGPQLVKSLAGHPPTAADDMNLGADPAYRVYPTADGRHVALGGMEQKFWVGLCELIGRRDLVDRRRTDPVGTIGELDAHFRTRTAAEWDALLADADVCYAPVHRLVEVPRDRHVREAGLIVDLPCADGIERPTIANPMRFSRTPVRYRAPAPVLDTSERTLT